MMPLVCRHQITHQRADMQRVCVCAEILNFQKRFVLSWYPVGTTSAGTATVCLRRCRNVRAAGNRSREGER